MRINRENKKNIVMMIMYYTYCKFKIISPEHKKNMMYSWMIRGNCIYIDSRLTNFRQFTNILTSFFIYKYYGKGPELTQ